MSHNFNALGIAIVVVPGFLPPEIVTMVGRTYYKLSQDPLAGEIHGLATLVAFDELNEEFLVWDGGSPRFDWESSIEEEAEIYCGIPFNTIEEVIYYLNNPQD